MGSQSNPTMICMILDWILGKFSSLKGLPSIGTGCQGKGLSCQPWRYLKNVWVWCLGTGFSGELGAVRLMVGAGDLAGLFQPKYFYDSMGYHCELWVTSWCDVKGTAIGDTLLHLLQLTHIPFTSHPVDTMGISLLERGL